MLCRSLQNDLLFDQPRDKVIRELVITEETYGKNLDYLVLIYFEKLKDICNENELKAIFSNVQNLRNFSIKLLNDLRKRLDNWTNEQTIGDLLIKFLPYLKLYQIYCNNYENALETVRECYRKKDFEALVEREKKNSGGLDLESLLITPVQRIPRYNLLLKELVKYTPTSHPDYAMLKETHEKILEIATKVNDGMKQFESAKVYDQIVESVKGILPYLEVHRKFLLEAQFPLATVKDKKETKFSNYWLILFSDMLFLASGSNKQRRKLQGFVKINCIWIKTSSKFDDCLEIVTPELCYLVKILSKEERKKWFDSIADLISSERSKSKKNDEKTRWFRYQFSHEGVYEGDWSNSKMDGRGTYWFINGNVYDGDWKHGLMEGTGTMKYCTGQIYEGEWKDGLPNGKGRLSSSYSYYEGQFRNGLKEGKGLLHWWNGDEYMGTFKNGRMDGEGKFTGHNGNIYEGSWMKDMIHGKGVFLYREGHRYEGMFYENRFHGWGKMTFNNGDIYEGEWKDGVKHGKGKLICNNRIQIYDGEWSNDTQHGKGGLTILREASNADDYYLKYDGEWSNGLQEGVGELTVNGLKYKGSWSEGQRVGQGTFTDCTGTYTGQWKNDRRNGSGIFVSNGGMKFQAEWKDDQKVGKGVVFNSEARKLTTEDLSDTKMEEYQPTLHSYIADLPMTKLLVRNL